MTTETVDKQSVSSACVVRVQTQLYPSQAEGEREREIQTVQLAERCRCFIRRSDDSEAQWSHDLLASAMAAASESSCE